MAVKHKKEKIKVKPRPKPKPKLINFMDYDTAWLKGTFDKSREMFQIIVIDSNRKRVDKIESHLIESGYVRTPQLAMEDFIRRNKSQVLDKIFNKLEEE